MTAPLTDASETTPLVSGMIRKSVVGLNDTESPSPDLEAASSSSSTSEEEFPSCFPVLVEIIGVRHLPVSNMESYCVMQYGTQTIHRTQPYTAKVTKAERVSRMLQLFGGPGGGGGGGGGNQVLQRNYQNPIWTIQHDAVFSCIVKSPHDLDNHKALTIQVWARPRPISMTGVALGMVASTAVRIGSNPRTAAGVAATAAAATEGGNNEDDFDDEASDHDGEADDCDHHDGMMAAATTSTTTQSPTASIHQQQHSTLNNNNKIQFIGKVRIPAPTLLSDYCTEQRIEVPLKDELGRTILQPDTMMETVLSIRCRMASQADLSFARTWCKMPHVHPTSPTREQYSLTHLLLKEALVLQEPHRVRATLITEVPESQVQGATLSSAMAGTISPTNRNKIKVKPYPDPFSNETRNKTQFLTPPLLKQLTQAPSRRWIQAGSTKGQKYGRLYIEVLSAHGLPNVDYGQRLGNQTDAFCCLIYGDCMAETDVIDDELSPHWLPWTQRAFCFALGHPSQVLYLAVFGYKRNPLQHAPIGRVEINTTNLQHDTLYDMHYNLTARSHKYNGRLSSGAIRVRVRVEVDDERHYLLASLRPAPSIYINTAKKKSMRVARYTAMGEYDTQDKFQLAVLQGYVDEILQGYVRRILYALQDGIRSLVLWRNQITFGKDGKYGFPLYSFLAFSMSVLAIEIPNLIPGMAFLGLALFMLVQMQQRIHCNPSPLKRCFGFGYYLKILLTGKSAVSFEEIKANHGLEEIEAIQMSLEERLKKDQEFFGKKEAVEKVIEEIEQERIMNQTNSVPLELLVILGKVQGIVGDVCRILRLVDTVLIWEESDLSFFLTLFLILCGFVMLFIPWAFVFTWTGRLSVLLLLGPQNKIVDLVYYRHIPTDEQKIRKLFMERMLRARVQQEDNRKLKAFRHSLFGKYATSVPSIMWTPHNDFPTPSSSARYHGSDSFVVPRAADLERCPFIAGQKLHGVMIPRPEGEWKMTQKESTEIMKKYRKLVKSKSKNTGDESKMKGVDNLDAASLASQEGFEVMEMYDEELGYVKNVLTPPRDESTMELGVEILQNSGEELQFENAYKSVHDFGGFESVDDDSCSTDAGNEATLNDGNGDDTSKGDVASQQSNQLNESRNGIEITEVSEQEAMFVQRSWRGLSSKNLNARLPSVRFSSGSVTMGQSELTSIQEMVTAEEGERPGTTSAETTVPGGSAASADSNDRFIDAMLSEDSIQVAPGTDDEDSRDSAKDSDDEENALEENGDGNSENSEEQLLAQYRSMSFDSAVASSYASSYEGDRSEYSTSRAATASSSMNEVWTARRSGSRYTTTFSDDDQDDATTLDRIGSAISGFSTGTSYTGTTGGGTATSFCSEEDHPKETSACEKDDDHAGRERQRRRCQDGAEQLQEIHENTTIQMSSTTDPEECGFEIFENP